MGSFSLKSGSQRFPLSRRHLSAGPCSVGTRLPFLPGDPETPRLPGQWNQLAVFWKMRGVSPQKPCLALVSQKCFCNKLMRWPWSGVGPDVFSSFKMYIFYSNIYVFCWIYYIHCDTYIKMAMLKGWHFNEINTYLFFGCPCGMWKFPGQGSNLCHSGDPCHSCGNAGSLICCPQGNFQLSFLGHILNYLYLLNPLLSWTIFQTEKNGKPFMGHDSTRSASDLGSFITAMTAKNPKPASSWMLWAAMMNWVFVKNQSGFFPGNNRSASYLIHHQAGFTSPHGVGWGSKRWGLPSRRGVESGGDEGDWTEGSESQSQALKSWFLQSSNSMCPFLIWWPSPQSHQIKSLLWIKPHWCVLPVASCK